MHVRGPRRQPLPGTPIPGIRSHPSGSARRKIHGGTNEATLPCAQSIRGRSRLRGSVHDQKAARSTGDPAVGTGGAGTRRGHKRELTAGQRKAPAACATGALARFWIKSSSTL
jgi:hypothetical protein